MQLFNDEIRHDVILDLPGPLAVVVSRWLCDLEIRGFAPATVSLKRRAIVAIYRDLHPKHWENTSRVLKCPLEEDLESLEQRWRSEGLSASTCDDRIAAWRSLIKFEAGVVDASALRGMLRYGARRRHARAAARKPVSRAEQQLAFEFFYSSHTAQVPGLESTLPNWVVARDYAMMLVMADTNATPSEICRMRQVLKQRDGQSAVWVCKGDLQHGHLQQIRPETRDAVENYQAACPFRPEGGDSHLFVGQHGEALRPRVVQDALQNVGRAAGLMQPLTSTGMKYGFGHELADAGESHLTIMKRLGLTTVTCALRATGWDAEQHALLPSIARVDLDNEDEMASKLARRFMAYLLQQTEMGIYTIAAYGGDAEKFLTFVAKQGLEPYEIDRTTIDRFSTTLLNTQAKATAARAVLSVNWLLRFMSDEALIAFDAVTGLIEPIARDEEPVLTDPSLVDAALSRLDGTPDCCSTSLATAIVSLAGIEGLTLDELRSLTRAEACTAFSSGPTAWRIKRFIELTPDIPAEVPLAYLPTQRADTPARITVRRLLAKELGQIGFAAMTPRQLRGSAIVRKLQSEPDLGEVARWARLANPDRLIPYIKATESLRNKAANDNAEAPPARTAA